MSSDAAAIREMFATVSLGSPENAIGFVLWRVVAHYQREVDRAIAHLSLTHLQFTTLALVAWFGRSDEPVTQAELARFGGIQPMQMSLMLKALEAKGFVRRKRDKIDSRANCVSITRSGLAKLRASLPLVIAVQSKLFGEDGRPGGPLHTRMLRLDHTGAGSE